MKFLQIFVLVILTSITPSFGQKVDSLQGRLAFGVEMLYPKLINPSESSKLGWGLSLKYYPNHKSALTIGLKRYGSDFLPNKSTNHISYTSIMLGGEKYLTFGKFSPFVGIEGGLLFIYTTSPANSLAVNKNFISQWPNYVAMPKAGFLYAVNEHIHLKAEGDFNYALNIDSSHPNPLVIDNNAFFVSKQNYLFSIGLIYKFDE
jgi:hypothetical protein